MTEDPDRALLDAVAAGDDDALRQLVRTHEEKLFRFVYRWTQDRADAAEIVSETFVRVYRNAAEYRPRAKVLTWIFRIATNLCRDRYRRKRPWQVFSLFATSEDASGDTAASMAAKLPAEDPAADEQLLRSEREEQLLAWIDDLPARLKAAFILYALEGHSQLRCAEMLGVSEKTVETRVYRARQRLLARFDRDEG